MTTLTCVLLAQEHQEHKTHIVVGHSLLVFGWVWSLTHTLWHYDSDARCNSKFLDPALTSLGDSHPLATRPQHAES